MLSLPYTLCFLTHADQVLLLQRRKPPNQGLWNGVGGHIEAGESPLAACLREVSEETGYTLATAHFAGLLTWEGYEVIDGGLYLFTAPVPDGEPVACNEGVLAWKPLTWLFTASEVVSNLHIVGPAIFVDHKPPQVYHFTYGHSRSHILRYVQQPLPTWVDIERPLPPPV